MTVISPLLSFAAEFSVATKTLWIAFIAVLFLLLIAVLVYMLHNRRRLQVEEDERARLAAILEQTKRRQKDAEQKLQDAKAQQEQTEKELREALEKAEAEKSADPLIIDLIDDEAETETSVDDEKKNRAFLATTAFLVGSDFELVSVIDLGDDSFEVFGGEGADALTRGTISYTEASRSFAQDLCVPEDREKVLWQTSIAGLREQLKDRDFFELTCDVVEGGMKKRKIMRFTRFNGSEDMLLATRRDVTELMEREARQKSALAAALLEAESTQGEKSEFLSSMSRTVKERMNELLILSASAAEESEDEKARAAFRSIRESGGAMTSMLADVLDVLELEGGKQTPSFDRVAVPDFMADIKTRALRAAAAKKLSYTLKSGGAAPKLLSFDKARMERVLMCVLENAVAFTAEGSEVSHTVTYSAPVNGRIYVRHVVADSGCGIGEEFLSSAFDPFTREHDTEGAGLGLFIAKHLIEALDGSIEIESAEGVGTTATVTLPAKAV